MFGKVAKKERGITLVALTVTIIVLVILASVSVAVLTGDNGMISKAKQAKDDTDNAENDEKNAIQDLYDIMDEKSESETMDEIKNNPEKYKHPDQSADNKDVGIGTDGKPVNLDLWKYELDWYYSGGEGIMLCESYLSDMSKPGYDNDNITKDGKIIGKVPQYIFLEEKGKVYKVTSMWYTFSGCTNLVEAPEVPKTVISMEYTFLGCDKLKIVPKIPDGIKYMGGTFYECENLIEIPQISKNVLSLYCAFYGCINLKKAPEIPENVENITGIFQGCKNLTGEIIINSNNLWGNDDCFKDTVKPITLTGTSQYLQEIAATANNGNVTVKE